jgi:hypothetical protein
MITPRIPIIASLLAAAGLHAGTVAMPDAMTPPEESGWSFRFAPYAWLTAIDGDIGINPLPTAPVDISFSDTLDKLDLAYKFLAEAGYGRWTLTADFVYGDFSNEVAGIGPFRNFHYEYTQWVLTPTVGYRVIETDDYSMDVFSGVRVTSFETTLTGRFIGGGQIQRGADDTWTDPIIGIRGQSELSKRLFIRYNGDIGGFGVSSDLVWQAFLGLGYRITENASMAVGYRALGVDYSSGEFSTLDVINHGPLLGLEFRF